MARAKRHYIPGQIWHITHRCHKREFLFKFIKDRKRWIHWLFEAKKRYGLVILNYTITSNHIHLLVCDGKVESVISKSIQLVAGRTGQEYNIRKNRKGSFWEDRYHATAVETSRHLLRCLVYIDLNMVRTGVVSHPVEWPFCGYNEILKPRRKNVLIDYQKLAELTGFRDYALFRKAYQNLVNESLANGHSLRQSKWTQSVAVGSEDFIKKIKTKLGYLAKSRKIIGDIEDGDFQLREKMETYNAALDTEKEDICIKNTYAWNNGTADI